MTAKIIQLDSYRTVPTVIQQIEMREDIVRQEVMRAYEHLPAVTVGLACDVAAAAVRCGKDAFTALDAARLVIETKQQA